MTIEEKFMDRVFIMTDGPGCWLWMGSIGPTGRPVIKWQGRTIIAARVSLMLATGKLPKDLCALHTCDNGGCVRPDHLYWGTKADNGRDMSARKRVVYDKGFIGRQGEENYGARFTNADIIEMRRLHWQQGESYADIGRQFHVNSGRVHDICNGKRWGHVKEGLPHPQRQAAPPTPKSQMLLCIAVLSSLRNTLLRSAS
jgi:hypothetical protein